MPPIADRRADVVGAEAEVVGRRGAEDGHAQLALDADVGQERALPDVVGADVGVVGGRADDRSSWSTPSPARDGQAGRDLRRDAGDAGERRAIASASSSARLVEPSAPWSSG